MTEYLTGGNSEDAGAESHGFTGAEGAEQLIGQASIVIGRPAPGETVEISAEPGQTYVLDFDPSQARAVVEGDNLILVFEDGSQIIFEDLVNLAQLENGPGLQYGGEDMIALLQAQGIIPGALEGFELTQPEPGQIILVQAELGQRFIINFDPALAQISVDGDNLVMTFPGGGQIVIAGLGGLTDDPNGPVFSIAGADILGGTLMGTAVALAEGEASPDATATLETAAGGEGPVGTGATRYDDDLGDTIDTIDAQGVIPPVEGDSTLIDLDPGPVEDVADQPAPPNTPPQADSVLTPADTDGELPSGLVAALGGEISIAYFKQLDVTVEIGDDDNFLGPVDMGGADAETALGDLVFTYNGDINFGTLVLESGGVFTVMSAGDTYTSADTVWWVATEEDVAEFEIFPDATFTYSVTDADGNVATATVTITADDQPTAEDDNPESDPEGTVVDEALGDQDGHGSVFTPVAVSGNVLANDDFGGDGAGTPEITEVTYDGALGTASKDTSVSGQITFTASNWTLVIITEGVNAGDYTFTQTGPYDHDVVQGTNSSSGSFTYTMQDSDGDSASADLTIQIVDDVPSAVADFGNVNEGALLTVAAGAGVLVNDDEGADGADVVGVRAAGGDTTTDVTTGVNASIAGLYGTLTLQADGSYTYQSTADTIASNQTDVFVYTIEDGDGDLSTTTLTINLTDSGLIALDDDEALVYEKALDTTVTGDDIAAGSITGSLPGDAGETDASNTLTDNVSGGFGALTYELVGSATGAYGTIQINADGTYVYTLTSPYETSPDANDGANTEDNRDSFTYQVTDAEGNTATATIYIDIVDDVPVVSATTNLIFANSSQSGTGVFDYTLGADGITYTGTNTDFSTITLSGTVGGVLIENADVTWDSEDATEAVFIITFDYAPNSSFPDNTVQAQGTLTFDKVSGTYTVELDIESFEILTTSNALDFQGWEPGTGDIQDNSGPADVVVAQLSDSFFVQFTGIDEPGGGTGVNNLTAIPLGSDGNYEEGDLFAQTATSVTVSATAAGVAGNTLQKGEVLDMDFFTTDPMGDTTLDPDAPVTDIFFKFDGVGSEDLVVILKLVNADGSERTTKAIIVENSDIFTSGDIIPSDYAGAITLDNNDGVVIIESNDYNFSTDTETWFIEGAQVLMSTEGITGEGINLDPNTGTTGGSEDDGVQVFDVDTETTDNDVLKITDIGFVTGESGTEDADLQFSFSIIDGDGDATATQTLDVYIESNGVFVGADGVAESIQGSSGDDTMTGGTGMDIFVFNLGLDEGTDTITDFASAEDYLSLLDVVDGVGDDIADVNAMIASITDAGGHVAVNFTNGTTVEFANVTFVGQTSIQDMVDDASQILVTHV